MDDDAARWATILRAVAREIDQRGGEGWLVGGCLRDAVLGVPVRDVDLAVTGDPLGYAEGLRVRLSAAIAPLRDTTVRLALGESSEASGRREIDISTLRGATIEDDVRLRDFRINALALPLAAYDEFVWLLAQAQHGRSMPPVNGRDTPELPAPAHLIDLIQGVADLRAGTLSPASPHALQDDPGRILRAARLIAARNLTPSRELVDAARANTPLLGTLPRDRVRDEMSALLALSRAWHGLDFLAECGALTLLLGDLFTPEVLAHGIASIRATGMLQETVDVAQSWHNARGDSGVARLLTLDGVRSWCVAPLPDGFPRLVAMRWGLLLHALVDADTLTRGGEPAAKAAHRVLERLPLAAHTRAIARAVLTCGEWRTWLAERALDAAALRHFFARFGDAGVDTLIGAVACGDALGGASGAVMGDADTVAEQVRMVLAQFFTERERLIPPPLLNGTDVMRTLGAPPGPAIKEALQAVRMAQLDGTISTQDEAIEIVKQHIHRLDHDEG